MDSKLNEYILNHIDKEPEYLKKLSRDTQIRFINGRMVSGHLQGRILTMLTKMIRPANILEIGTYTGYATICLAEGGGRNCRVDTIEINEEIEELIEKWTGGSEYNKNIHYHIGDAKTIIKELNLKYDLIFIDANKREYTEYYKITFPYLKKGGFILADNTLWSGKIIEDIKSNDQQTIAISKFNDYIASNPEIEKVILPVRDGITIIRKK